MTIRSTPLIVGAVTLATVPALAQQPYPTSQPAMISITREIEKAGHFGPHEQTEIRWAALTRSRPDGPSTMAMVAKSGVQEIWWVTAYSGLDAWGKAYAGADPAYTAALNKIALEDSEHITNSISTQAVAVPEISRGAFPEARSIRVVQVTTVQLRPGQFPAFVDLSKKWMALLDAKGVKSAWSTYSALSGAPDGTLLMFASYPSWDAVEAERKAFDAMYAAAGAELAPLNKGWADAVANSNTRYFTVNPKMSTVPKEMINDPFWSGK